jgi:Pvc16 N-terminal domain
MIAEAVGFLRDRLNHVIPRAEPGEPGEDVFVYVGTGKEDAVTFKGDSVSVMLIRIEEDNVLRPPDLYARISADGVRTRVEPEIRINLYVLFVARFADDYSRSLYYLSRLIGYFQGHRLFNPDNSPELKAGISQLVLELVTPSFSEQNEIWGSLRVAYQPCALYRVKLFLFGDTQGQALADVKRIVQSVAQVPPAPS